jgi:hypothetical protein
MLTKRIANQGRRLPSCNRFLRDVDLFQDARFPVSRHLACNAELEPIS